MEPGEILLETLTETVTDHSIEKLRFRLGILNNQLLYNNQPTPDQTQMATITKGELGDRETERLRLGTLMESTRSTTPT